MRLVTIALTASGCGTGLALGPITNLEDARERWRSADIQTYQFEYHRNCFCLPQATGPALVTVRNGVVAQVELQPPTTGEPILEAFPTIDEIFQIIETAMDEDWDRLEVEYDNVLGFPKSLTVDPSLGVADDESWYTLSKVKKIQD